MDISRRNYQSPTGSLVRPEDGVYLRELVPQTAYNGPSVALIDLRGRLLSPMSLRELIVPLGQNLRGGAYGDLRVVVVTRDSATQEQIELLAKKHGFPMFVATDIEPESIKNATPVGELTRTDVDSLNIIRDLGGAATVSRFALHVGIESTAANNRVVNAEKKGYLVRIARPRRFGDLFVDPRISPDEWVISTQTSNQPGPREALVSSGIITDPYDKSPLVLEGEDETRAKAIMAKRGRKTQ